MVLDVNGEMLRARLERDALRDRPAEQDAVALEPEVVMEAARVVPLDDEDRRLAACALPNGSGVFRRERLRS